MKRTHDEHKDDEHKDDQQGTARDTQRLAKDDEGRIARDAEHMSEQQKSAEREDREQQQHQGQPGMTLGQPPRQPDRIQVPTGAGDEQRQAQPDKSKQSVEERLAALEAQVEQWQPRLATLIGETP